MLLFQISSISEIHYPTISYGLILSRQIKSWYTILSAYWHLAVFKSILSQVGKRSVWCPFESVDLRTLAYRSSSGPDSSKSATDGRTLASGSEVGQVKLGQIGLVRLVKLGQHSAVQDVFRPKSPPMTSFIISGPP